MKIDMDIAKQIENINFFERCGFNDRKNLSLNHSFVAMLVKRFGYDPKSAVEYFFFL